LQCYWATRYSKYANSAMYRELLFGIDESSRFSIQV
jgi:hypothetical protein